MMDKLNYVKSINVLKNKKTIGDSKIVKLVSHNLTVQKLNVKDVQVIGIVK